MQPDNVNGNGSPGDGLDDSGIKLNNTEQIKILNAIHKAEQLIPNFKKCDFPGICVIGDQSSGKTSLLESLCGFALPRGTGLVTRTPLEIVLRPGDAVKHVLTYNKDPANSSTNVTVEFSNPEEISAEIEKATIVVAGEGKNIVDNPLRLEVVGPGQPTLDLTDLPGIVQNVTGNQEEEIKDAILRMIRRYMAGATTIIVCVVPSTSAGAANVALNLAKECDPGRKRTLGVLTKADTAVADLKTLRCRLDGKDKDEVMLKLGYYAVYCNAGGESHLSPQQWRAGNHEQGFFSQKKELRTSMRVGVKALGEKMASLLLDMLLKSSLVSEIKDQIDKHLAVIKADLQRMPPTIANEWDANTFMENVFQRIAARFLIMQKGDIDGNPANAFAGKLQPEGESLLKARKHLRIMVDKFEKAMLVKCNPAWYLTDEGCDAICSEFEDRPAIVDSFSNEVVFEKMLQKHIAGKLLSLYKELVRNVRQYILDCLKTLATVQLEDFPSMLQRVNKLLQELIDDKRRDALQAVERMARTAMDVSSVRHPTWTNFRDYFEKRAEPLDEQYVMPNGSKFTPAVVTPEIALFYLDMLRVTAEEEPVLQEELVGSLQDLNVKQPKDNDYLKLRMELAVYTDVIIREAIDFVPRMVTLLLSTEVQESFITDMRDRLRKLALFESDSESGPILPMMESAVVVEKRMRLESDIKNLSEVQSDMERIVI